jgi:hypothetical protein
VKATYLRDTDAIELVFRGGMILTIPRIRVPVLADIPQSEFWSVTVAPGGDALSWRSLDIDIDVIGLIRALLPDAVTTTPHHCRQSRQACDRISRADRRSYAQVRADSDRLPVFAVVAPRTSGKRAGEARSGHQAELRLLAVNTRRRSAVDSGGHEPPGSCAHTRITPSSVTAHVAHPSEAPVVLNQS